MASVQQIDRGGGEPATEITEDELFDVLANQRRRFAVHLLKREEDDTIAIGEMAEQIAAWENDIDAAESPATSASASTLPSSSHTCRRWTRRAS